MRNVECIDTVFLLLRTLSHKIRTPLSVISNDLNYLKTLIEPAECERGINKCRQISDFFKPLQLLQTSSENASDFILIDLLRDIFTSKLKTRDSLSQLKINGSRNNFYQAIKWLSELFLIEEVQLKKSDLELNAQIYFKLAKSLKVFIDEETQILLERAIAVSKIYSLEAVDDSILPMLIDAILFSFSCECRVLGEDEIIFALEVVDP